MKSRQYNTGRFPAPAICTRAFEKTSGVINAAGVEPVVQGKVQHPEFRRWGFDAYCNHQYRNEVRNLADMFRDEYEGMFANLA